MWGVYDELIDKIETYKSLATILGISYHEVIKLSPEVEETKSKSRGIRTGYKIILNSASEKILKKLTFRVYKGERGHEIPMPNPFLFS